MPENDSISFSLRLPLLWWRRLQRVAEHCHTSPGEFLREVLEAEVVRRELREERRPGIEEDWLTMMPDPLSAERLHWHVLPPPAEYRKPLCKLSSPPSGSGSGQNGDPSAESLSFPGRAFFPEIPGQKNG